MAVTLAEWTEWMFAGGEQWTDWLPLSETEFARVPEGEGAYVVGIKDRAKIGRLLEDDPHSVIDIGESMQLRERLRDFVRCAGCKGQRGHMAGWRLGSFGLLERLGGKVDNLQFSYRKATSKEDAYRIEGQMLRVYFDIFGELPPLNYKFNWVTWIGE